MKLNWIRCNIILWINLSVFTFRLTDGTFINCFQGELEHLSEHKPWYIYYPVSRRCSSIVSCGVNCQPVCLVLLRSACLCDSYLSRWGMRSQSSSCWCGWRRPCQRGRRRSWRLQSTSITVEGECTRKYMRWRRSEIPSEKMSSQEMGKKHAEGQTQKCFTAYFDIVAANRKTAEDRALRPSLQVDPTLLSPTTGEIHSDSSSSYYRFLFNLNSFLYNFLRLCHHSICKK